MRHLIALALLAACAKAPPPVAPTTVVFVRHAEKAKDHPDDPTLTAEGSARAQALAKLLAHGKPTHLYATEYKRTQLTLAPLASALGLSPTVLSSKDPSVQVDALRALAPGTIAVVAGHSNTVPQMIRKLGGNTPDLADPDYDRVLVASFAAAGPATVLELRLSVTATAAVGVD